MNPAKTYEQLVAENERLREQLDEATELIQAIRTGQVDALLIEGANGQELYTLKTADQAYRVFIENMNEGAVTLNENGLIVYCNSSFAALVGTSLSYVIGLSFEAFVAESSREVYQELAREGWQQTQKAELAMRGTSQDIPCQLSVTALELSEGTALSVIVTDLSQQKETQRLLKVNNARLEQMNADLEISNQNLQQFAYIASHDLQEPLRKITAFGDRLKSLFSDESAPASNYINRMQLAARRMSLLIEDLLNFSRISSRQAAHVPVSLEEVVRGVLNDLEERIEESGAQITVARLPRVQGDASQLSQLFQNLLSNALKFRQPGVSPQIRIESRRVAADHIPPAVKLIGSPHTYHCIEVLDNGIGFENQYVSRIFQVFQRLHGKSEFAGTGIGLAICEKVAINHGGAITATSQPGQGATFQVYLPV